MNFKKLTLFLLVIPVVQFACSHYPETPEKVIEQFVIYLGDGECDKAMDLCIENAKESVQGAIDAGCKPYDVEVDSVKCQITENIAKCYCYEKVEGMGMTFPYLLELIPRLNLF